MSTEKLTPTSVTFEYGENKSETVVSNWLDFTNIESVAITKSCLSENYFLGDKITYIIDIKNNSDIPLFNVKIKEDMGSQSSKNENNSNPSSPLKYAGGFKYYVNGNPTKLSEPKTYSDKIIFEIDTLPALSNAIIIYSAKVTENAPLKVNSSITNSSSLIITSTGKTLTASNIIKVREIAEIKTIKQIKNFSKSRITYAIFIYNYGNIAAKNVTIKDKIEHTSSNLTIKVGSQTLASSDYSLNANDLQIPSYGSQYSLSVPESKFIKDENSGKFGIVPGIVEIIIDCKV